MRQWQINVQPEWYDSTVQIKGSKQELLVRRVDFGVVERTGAFRAFVLEVGELTRYSVGSHANMAPGNYLRIEYFSDPESCTKEFAWVTISPHEDTVEIQGLIEWSGRVVLPMTQELFDQLMVEPTICPD